MAGLGSYMVEVAWPGESMGCVAARVDSMDVVGRGMGCSMVEKVVEFADCNKMADCKGW